MWAHGGHALDADGALADNRNHGRRWFSGDQAYSGVFVLRDELDAEGGAVVKTVLDALGVPTGPDDGRSTAQRRGDAARRTVRLSPAKGADHCPGGVRLDTGRSKIAKRPRGV